MPINLQRFELSKPSKRKEMMESALEHEMVGTNFDSQNHSEQVAIWKNAVYNVWKTYAHSNIFAQNFIETYCDNGFTLQYLIQSLSAASDIPSIVHLCNGMEQLCLQHPHWYSNQASVVGDFTVSVDGSFDPMQRLNQLCTAGLSPLNIRSYCYATVMLNPQHWDLCVAKTQQSETEFLFNALRRATKDFSDWGAYQMIKPWPKLLSLSQWETDLKSMVGTRKFQRTSWIAHALDNPAPQDQNLDHARSVEHVLELFAGPCLEESLPNWRSIALVLKVYPKIHATVEQRIEESERAHQHQRISASIDTNGTRSTARKI